MTELQKLELGIEIISAIKADCYSVDIETGRIFALSETEIDRLEGVSKADWESFTNEEQEKLRLYCLKEKERLHKQAMFVANATIKKIASYDPFNKLLEIGEFFKETGNIFNS